MNESYQDVNARTIDDWVDDDWQWGRPVDSQTYARATRGDWSVVLTPTKAVPASWFPDLRGKKILGLASGGGQQIPLFTAAGASCTVFDNSRRQLDQELSVASREGYEVDIVRGDMTKALPFEDAQFDLIFHPVSNCYIEDVEHVWRESFRILKPGGSLLSGFDNGFNYLFDEDESVMVNKLPFNPLKDPELYRKSVENGWGIQFSHSIETQIAGQIRAGFRLMDIYQDTNGEGLLHQLNVPTFYATLSGKPG